MTGKTVVQAAEVTDRAEQRMCRSIWLPGVILSVLAILLRILVATRREGIDIDGITYLRTADAILHDWKAISVLHPPLYSVILAPFLGLWDDPEWGARVISAALGGLWVWPTLWLAREATEERVFWTAGLLAALTPAAVEASTRILAEAAFGLCLATFLAALLRAFRTVSVGYAAFAGVLGGLATLARPEGMGFLFFGWGLLLVAPIVGAAQWTKQLVLNALICFTVTWCAVLFPYMVLVKQQTGAWQWSGKLGWTLRWAESVGQERQREFAGQVMTDTREADLPQSLVAYVLSRPGEVLSRVVINLHLIDKYTLSKLLHGGGLVLVVLGLIHLRYRRAPAAPEWFLVAALLPLAGLLLFLVEARYFVSMTPVLSVIAGIGLARVGRQGEPDASGRLSAAAAVLLTVVVLSFVPYIARPWFRQDPAAVEKAAGLWLFQREGTGSKVIGNNPRIAYYAQMKELPFSGRSLDELLEEGRKAGARFLIADTMIFPQLRPDLLALTAKEYGPRPGLDLVHIEEDRTGNRVLIYRIK